MAYVLDIAVILILGLAIFFGAKKGFIESTIGLISMVLAVVAACLLNGPLANFAYTSFVQPNVETAIETRISEAVEATGVTEPSAYLAAAEEELPGFVRSLLEKHEFSLAGADVQMEETLETTARTVAVSVTEQVVKPPMLLLLRVLIALLVFIILLILLNLLGKLVSKLIRLTPLKSTDSFLGGVLGAVKGVLWVLLAVTVMQAIAAFTAPDAWLSQSTIENSFLVSRIAAVNPIYGENAALISEMTALFR